MVYSRHIYAVESMLIKMNDAGFRAPVAPVVPNLGCIDGFKSARNFPEGSAYAFEKYLIPIATAVNPVDMIPTSENGVKEDKSFRRQSGNKIPEVTPAIVVDLLKVRPALAKIDRKVSPKIIE